MLLPVDLFEVIALEAVAPVHAVPEAARLDPEAVHGRPQPSLDPAVRRNTGGNHVAARTKLLQRHAKPLLVKTVVDRFLLLLLAAAGAIVARAPLLPPPPLLLAFLLIATPLLLPHEVGHGVPKSRPVLVIDISVAVVNISALLLRDAGQAAPLPQVLTLLRQAGAPHRLGALALPLLPFPLRQLVLSQSFAGSAVSVHRLSSLATEFRIHFLKAFELLALLLLQLLRKLAAADQAGLRPVEHRLPLRAAAIALDLAG
mmetsp:Transcript_11132/g.28174  ORF Transcript_11132/g.28174 Transcript_11132/m.28174 type:complete len:258 (+) Transcript_11132:1012-1785(+)